MAEDIESQVLEAIKNSPFYGIQIDEATDVAKKAILVCFVRFESGGEVSEELLC